MQRARGAPYHALDYAAGSIDAVHHEAGVGRVSAPTHASEQVAMPLSKAYGSTKCSDRFAQGRPHIGIGEKRSGPIGVGGA